MSNVIPFPPFQIIPLDPLRGERVTAIIGLLRRHAKTDITVQMTPESAALIADLIEQLAARAGVEMEPPAP